VKSGQPFLCGFAETIDKFNDAFFMQIELYAQRYLNDRIGMPIPLHTKVRYQYFPGTQLIKVIRFFLNESEVAHILHAYVGGTPNSNSALPLEQELKTGPFIE